MRGEGWQQKEGGGIEERYTRVNAMQNCVYVEVNAKMIPVETTPGIKGVRNENG
jgi:hypothetical protein